MVYAVSFLIVSVCFLIFLQTFWIWNLRKTQEEMKKKQDEDTPTMFEVRDLLLEGERELAIEVYQEIFDCSRTIAEKEVSDIEKSMNL